ncbi:alpha-L-fucosidase [Shewanella electrodiphila]|uniref:alpha-L-fucosidase n=1 Tax=Shewanella electrodiphila TaxID=934143 RepID=A0ABT0KMA2_9GAMM|nr:alpha-L-fucosidase [Shewanella electrodiphila]MCL1044980.1 alpha-L-fucosidase [Shewanella electrodiphila]
MRKLTLKSAVALAVTASLFSCSQAPVAVDSQTSTKPAKAIEQVPAVNLEQKLASIHQVANQGPYKADFTSFSQYEIPAWYQDAKFGIFIHWGVYSVPAYNGEWYPRKMYRDEPKSDEKEHHAETWGAQTEFGYKDFVPMFTAEKFNADEWLNIIKASGAKYIVPVAEHHDGFSMYDNSYSRWDSVEMGPKRDIIAELKAATEKVDIHFGLSSHRAENWWFFDGGREMPSDVQDEANRDLYGPAINRDTSEAGETPPTKEFMDDWLLRTVEIVDKYEPELIWFDWWIASPAFHDHVEAFTAYYYNKGVSWDHMPALNYKEHKDFRSFVPGSAVLDIERGGMTDIHEHFWQTDTSVSKTSWGYVTNHQYRDANSLVDDMIDIVSKNGSLLLNIGPKADGTIPEAEVTLLKEIGDWLAINGEAIYSTRPWVTYGEGETEVVDGKHSNNAEKNRKDFNSSDVRFTRNEDTLYATLLAWPGNGNSITINSINAKNYPDKIAKISLIGQAGELKFSQDADGLTVVLPQSYPSEYAQVLKITQ